VHLAPNGGNAGKYLRVSPGRESPAGRRSDHNSVTHYVSFCDECDNNRQLNQQFTVWVGLGMKKIMIWALILGGASYGGAKWHLHNKVSDSMDMAVLMMSPYADVEYDGVRSTMSGELTIEGIRVNMHDFRDDIHIERLGIDTPSFFSLLDLADFMSMQGSGMPDSFGFLLEGFHIPTDADYFHELYALGAEFRGAPDTEDAGSACTGKYGLSPAMLTELGYSEQVFSMTMKVDNEGGKFGLAFTSSVEDMWDVDANITLAGDLLTEMMKGASYRPRLSNMTIDYTDRSLNERVRKYCKRLGLSVEETLQAQMDTFRFYGESNGIVFDEYLLDPYLQFLRGKDRIVITAKPNEPIAMSQIDLYKASDVPALLNLEAQAY
jgi:hypothetical protein